MYREHLRALYSTEMYYGDDTMKHLIAHTNSLSTTPSYTHSTATTSNFSYPPNAPENQRTRHPSLLLWPQILDPL